jgi:hypothetical protein
MASKNPIFSFRNGPTIFPSDREVKQMYEQFGYCKAITRFTGVDHRLVNTWLRMLGVEIRPYVPLDAPKRKKLYWDAVFLQCDSMSCSNCGSLDREGGIGYTQLADDFKSIFRRFLLCFKCANDYSVLAEIKEAGKCFKTLCPKNHEYTLPSLLLHREGVIVCQVCVQLAAPDYVKFKNIIISRVRDWPKKFPDKCSETYHKYQQRGFR